MSADTCICFCHVLCNCKCNEKPQPEREPKFNPEFADKMQGFKWCGYSQEEMRSMRDYAVSRGWKPPSTDECKHRYLYCTCLCSKDSASSPCGCHCHCKKPAPAKCELDKSDDEKKVRFSNVNCIHSFRVGGCANCWIDSMPTRTPESEYVLIDKKGLRELVELARKEK